MVAPVAEGAGSRPFPGPSLCHLEVTAPPRPADVAPSASREGSALLLPSAQDGAGRGSARKRGAAHTRRAGSRQCRADPSQVGLHLWAHALRGSPRQTPYLVCAAQATVTMRNVIR